MDTFDSITRNDKIVRTFPDVGTIISKALPIVFSFAGLVLLLTLIWGGFILMTASGDAGKIKEGYGKITAALVGFMIMVVAFFLAQILQVVLHVKFL